MLRDVVEMRHHIINLMRYAISPDWGHAAVEQMGRYTFPHPEAGVMGGSDGRKRARVEEGHKSGVTDFRIYSLCTMSD